MRSPHRSSDVPSIVPALSSNPAPPRRGLLAGAVVGLVGLLAPHSAAQAAWRTCATHILPADGTCRSKAGWTHAADQTCSAAGAGTKDVTVSSRCTTGGFAKATVLCCAAASLVCCTTAGSFSVTSADACTGDALALERCASTVCCDGADGPALTTLDSCTKGALLPLAACDATTPPTPPLTAATYPVVDTAQDRCFDLGFEVPCAAPGAALGGQDAWYQGNQPSLVDNGDGTVTDQVTGLLWQKSPGAKVTYAQAKAGAAALTLGGHTDWRLPTIKELYSLIRFDGVEPTCCETLAMCPAIQPFIDDSVFDFAYGDTTVGERVIDAQFATSTIYVGDSELGTLVFGVNFADGRIKGYGLQNLGTGADMKFFVLYVRGDGYGQNAFVDNGDGTVTDQATGLTWLQSDSGAFGAGDAGDGGLDWEQALAWAEALTFAGHSDWRLPTAKELQTLVDYTRSPSSTGSAAIDPLFQATPIVDEAGVSTWGFYWTSTSHVDAAGGASKAVYVAFGEALGFMQDPFGNTQLLDVHGAGAQRSDPKTGDPANYPTGFGPQGDVVRIYNLVRPVRGGATAGAVSPTSFVPAGGDNQCGGGAPGGGDPNGGGTGTGGTGGQGPSGIAMCGVVPPGLPCCGDGFCGGPETHSNCPEDC